MGDRTGAYRVSVGKHEGKRQLGKPRSRREDNIKIYLIKIGWEGFDWIDLAVDRDKCWAVVNTVMNLRAAYSWGNFFTSWGNISL